MHFRGLHSTHMEFGRITTVLFIEVSLFQGVLHDYRMIIGVLLEYHGVR